MSDRERRPRFTAQEAHDIGERIGIDWSSSPYGVDELLAGMRVELEHGVNDASTNVTDDDPVTTAKIARAHLNEFADYYLRLERMEEEAMRGDRIPPRSSSLEGRQRTDAGASSAESSARSNPEVGDNERSLAMEAHDEPTPERRPLPAERELSGWVIFVGVALMVIGSLDALWGLAAVLNNEIVLVGGRGALIIDVTTWGWVHLILGSVMGLTGLGLFAENAAARFAAIFLVAVNAVAQIVWFPAAPLWALMMIVLDVAVIYQLTAGWEESGEL